MAPAPNPNNSLLGDSWAVNEADSSDASLDEGAPSQQSPTANAIESMRVWDRDVPTPPLPSSPSPSPSRRRRRTSRASPAASGPELIIPSLRSDGDGASRSAAVSSVTDMSQARKRPSRASALHSPEVARRNGHGARSHSHSHSLRLKSLTLAEQPTKSDLSRRLVHIMGNSAEWLLEVVGGALKALRWPISCLLALYLFAGLLVLVNNLLVTSLYTALSPVCLLPGVSLLHLPMCKAGTALVPKDAIGAEVEFDKLMTAHSSFEEILDQSVAYFDLPQQMKISEGSVRDLRQVVYYSDVTSRNELLLEFDGFIQTARSAISQLQKFNSLVGRAVDHVLIYARATQWILDDLASKNSSRGLVEAFISDKIFALFQPFNMPEIRLLNEYMEHLDSISTEIERLETEASNVLSTLGLLDDYLEAIDEFAYKDNRQTQRSKHDILTTLWTRLGGNKIYLGELDQQLDVLRQVIKYRKIAWAHVSSTLLKLQTMQADIKVLKERIDEPKKLPHRAAIPFSFHLQNIRLGVERLERRRREINADNPKYQSSPMGSGKEAEAYLRAGFPDRESRY